MMVFHMAGDARNVDPAAEAERLAKQLQAARPEAIARAFHEAYERLAPDHGYETRKASAVPWEQVPEQNKSLMIAVVASLMEQGIIR